MTLKLKGMIWRVISLFILFLGAFIGEVNAQEKKSGPFYKNATAKEKYHTNQRIFLFPSFTDNNYKRVKRHELTDVIFEAKLLLIGNASGVTPGYKGPMYKNYKPQFNRKRIYMRSLRDNQFGD